MNIHERRFVESFVKSTRRDRALLALANPKKRKRFVYEFAHQGTYILAPECLRSIQPNQQHAETICSILRSLGAPETCHVISEGRFDGEEVELLEALYEFIGRGMATVLSCVPGELGYFEGETRERYILQNAIRSNSRRT